MQILAVVILTIGGLLTYALAQQNATVKEIGRLVFFAGMLALMFAMTTRPNLFN